MYIKFKNCTKFVLNLVQYDFMQMDKGGILNLILKDIVVEIRTIRTPK